MGCRCGPNQQCAACPPAVVWQYYVPRNDYRGALDRSFERLALDLGQPELVDPPTIERGYN